MRCRENRGGLKLNSVIGYDLIGDIHGHADELKALLDALGYKVLDGAYRHADRKAIFLGDFIDRGPKILEVLQIVRGMVNAEEARAVMGNHELNALAFHTTHSNRDDQSLRPRTMKNIRQHAATLCQLKEAELTDALQWFRSLPMWLEVTNAEGRICRAVHACWDEQEISVIKKFKDLFGGIESSFLTLATKPDSPLFKATEIVLKGKEVKLPDGEYFLDKDGHKRTAVRSRWFDVPAETYGDYALESNFDCNIKLPAEIRAAAKPYPTAEPPVFVGHYWLDAPTPKKLAVNVACLDYSVAKKRLPMCLSMGW